MDYEKLPPENLVEELLKRKEEMELALKMVTAELRKAPEGRLRIARNKNTAQYYFVKEGTGKNGVYIRKENLGLIKLLAQKHYDEKLIPLLKRELGEINHLIKFLQENDFSGVYETLSREWKHLIEPVTITDEEYIKKWEAVKYKGKEFYEGAPELYTLKGEKVRSKSEVIIADTLGRLKIPYRYEFPVKLKKLEVYPDFYCLNVKSRREFIWEHLGMMGDPEYADRAVKKISAYEEAGFFPGRNLIITMETENSPVSSRQVERIAKKFLA